MEIRQSPVYSIPHTIYHYCSVNVFKSIIEQKKLWMTDILKSNDYLETKSFLYFLIDYFKENYPQYHIEDEVNAINNAIKEHISPTYAVCFSEEGDLLSQWRGYSEDGTGLAIGLKAEYFNIINALSIEQGYPDLVRFSKVIYNEELKSSAASEIINSRLSEKITLEDGKEFPAVLLNSYIEACKCAHFYKNSAFKEEKEWRFVISNVPADSLRNGLEVQGVNTDPLKFYCSKGNLISYLSLNFDVGAISRIVIGPKCTINKYDIELLMQINDIDPKLIHISKSTASYR